MRGMSEPMTDGPVQQSIERHLRDALAPALLKVANESHMHSVPPGSESHFRVVVVADSFQGQPLVRRHRRVNQALRAELDAGLHALSIIALTPAQYEQRNGPLPATPTCRGGSVMDKEMAHVAEATRR
jgi:BolA family transcriptional regulator, general stress-responsive regulator